MIKKPTFQTKVRISQRTGDEKDFRNGCASIHDAIIRVLKDNGVTASVDVSLEKGRLWFCRSSE
jgi:hypothetical protein